MPKTEETSFLDDVLVEEKEKPNPLDEPIVPVKPAKAEEDDKDEDEDEDEADDATAIKPRDNREARRAKEQLRKEREDNAFMAGRLEAMGEAARTASSSEAADYLKQVERIYGTNTPEAAEATRLLQEALKGVHESAVEKAYERFNEDKKREATELKEARERLSGMVEDVEDEFNITMTPALQTSFFNLLQRMSPKDASGQIIEYADPFAVFESLQTRIQTRKTDTKAKDIASRSMAQSASASADAAGKTDPTWEFLKKDLGW